MRIKKVYIKPGAYVIEMDNLMNAIINGSVIDETPSDEWVSKGTAGWESLDEYDDMETSGSYSASNWRKDNLWDTSLWD